MQKNKHIFFLNQINRVGLINKIMLFILLFTCLAGPLQAKNLKVRVGYFPNITHSQALVGMGNGYFSGEMGSTVRIESYLFNAGPSAMEALLVGQLDLAYVGPNPALNTYIRSKGRALRILAGACSGGAAFVMRKDTKIQCPAEFADKKLGSPQLGNTQDVALRYYLMKNNLKTRENGGSVSVFPAGNSNIILLFRRAEIEGAWTVEPWVSRLVTEEEGYIFLDEGVLWPNGTYPTTYLVGSVKFIREHPELVKKWVKAHLGLTIKLQEDPELYIPEINRELEKWIGQPMPINLLRSAFSRLKFTCNPMEKPFEVMAERAMSLGFLKELPSDLSNVFALSYLNSAVEEGEYAKIP